MRAKLGILLAKLYVYTDLDRYSTRQWSVFSKEAQAGCSAEVRVDGYGEELDELEAQVILTYNTPKQDMPPLIEIMLLRAEKQKTGDYKVVKAVVRGQDLIHSEINQAEQKTCQFFTLIVQELEKNVMPNFDALQEMAFYDTGNSGDKWGDGGGRSPKIKTDLLLKAGHGF